MHCSKCGRDNSERHKFCASCGAPLTVTCPKCGTTNQPVAKFCGDCGAPLEAVPPTSVELRSSSATLTGERRHLTILFCDLVGSVMLTSRLDPEDWHATLGDYRRAASEAITVFGGEVMRYVGDGIMAFFGYPVAHDNDAERAARAGLAILNAIAKLNESHSGRPKLSLRIGIDSGRVVVGTGAGQAVDAFGDAANIAARLQVMADPDSVVVSGATHRLISGLFVVEDRGVQNLKGIEQPVQLYRIVRPSGMRSRFEAAAAAGGLTPFVGRQEELRSLLTRWERVREGEGQVALIVGEAGIGKSRLVQRFHETIAGAPHTWLEAGAGAFFQNTPFYPVSETLRQLTSGEQDSQVNLALRLEAAGLAATEGLPLLAPLLNLPLPPEYRPSTLPPDQQRRRLLATLVNWMLGAARAQPLVIFIEDLQWADPSSLELIQLLVEQGATAPLMLLHTARPEFHTPWPLRSHHMQLNLNRLSVREVRTMVSELAAQKALPDETVATLVQRTGGVPLFVEELTRVVLESGAGKLSAHEIPVTLHDSLMARLDRLGSAREVAQIGAAIGGEFSYELLRALHPTGEQELENELRKLAAADLLYVRGIPPEATYQFKHALIRDTAYESLLKSRRKEFHLRIAEVLVHQSLDRVTSAPELLAHHYTEAGLIAQAIPHWQLAGQKAIERSANLEAVSHLTKGLKLLESLPEAPERAQQEMTLQLMLGVPLMATKGWTAPEVGRVYGRALELCRQLGETPELFPALYGLWTFYGVGLQFHTSHELAEQLLRLGRRAEDPALLVVAHYALGSTSFAMGALTAAQAYLEQGIGLYNPAAHRSLAFRYGSFDPGVGCLNYEAWALWHLGYPDQALKKIERALTLVRESGQPFTLAVVLSFASYLHQYRREWHAAQELAEAAIDLSNEQGFAVWLTVGTILRGRALSEQGQIEDGIAQMHQGLERNRVLGIRTTEAYNLAVLAEAYGKTGRFEKGLTILSEALALVDLTEERAYDPELYRLKGQLTLQLARLVPSTRHSNLEQTIPSGQSENEAEVCFRRAIEIARRQSAKSWELRATTSLARLQAGRGRRDEARSMLAEIYGWFTEGFDTLDLQEAKTLLGELST